LRRDFARALDDDERRQLRRVRNVAVGAVVAASAAFVAAAGRAAPWPLAIYAFFIFSLAGIYLGWLPRVVERRYLADAGGDLAAARNRLAARRRRAFFGWLVGAVSGLLGLLIGLHAAGQLPGV
ncbi:MAG: hypothetical protein AAFY88_13855, partial [Acidobacteriota bacterium]